MDKKNTPQISPDIVLNAFHGNDEALKTIADAGFVGLLGIKKGVQAWSKDYPSDEEKCREALDLLKDAIDKGYESIEDAIEF